MVDIINSEELVPWQIRNIILNIRSALLKLNNAKVQFAPRSANHAANWATNRARVCKESEIWIFIRPPELLATLNRDQVSCIPYVRFNIILFFFAKEERKKIN